MESAWQPGFGRCSGSVDQALTALVRSPAAHGNPGLSKEVNISQAWEGGDLFPGSPPLKEGHNPSQLLRGACAPQGRLGSRPCLPQSSSQLWRQTQKILPS